MFNIFENNTKDFDYMLQSMGQDIFVDGLPSKAIISHQKTIRTKNDIFISTKEPFERGATVYYKSLHWLLQSPMVVNRYDNYKGLLTLAEHVVTFNLQGLENEAGEQLTKYLLRVPAVVSRTSDFSSSGTITNNLSVETIDSELHIFITDNERTRMIIAIEDQTSNNYFLFSGERYEIVGVSTVNKGVLEVTAKKTTMNSYSDKINDIAWKEEAPNDWESKIDDILLSIFFTSKIPSIEFSDPINDNNDDFPAWG